MSRNIHLKFRMGQPELGTVSAAAVMLGVSIESLAREALIHAARAIIGRTAAPVESLDHQFENITDE